jgi:osmotically-inducible protein OsmY
MRGAFILTALIGATGASGCVTAAVGAVAGVGAIVAQERSMGAALDDGAAATELRSRLIALDARGFADVSIEIAEGRLLLSGTTPTIEHRIDAERIAWSIEQIDAVANELVVGETTSLWRAGMDEVITAQVRARLVAARDVRAVDVNVETSQGTVYLLGLARNEAEIQRAAEIASYTPGVQRVVSYMHVRAPRERLGPPVPVETAAADPAISAGAAVGVGAAQGTIGAPLDLNRPQR